MPGAGGSWWPSRWAAPPWWRRSSGPRAWTLVGLPSIAGLPDAGALVTVGSPVLRALTTAAGVATLALLVLALSVDPARKGGTLSRLGRRDATLAARAAGAWTVLAVLQAMWVFADVLAMPVPQAWSPSMVAAFWWEVPQIRALILVALLAAVAAALASVSTRVVGVGVATALSGIAIVVPTVSGHASGTSAHALLLASGTAHALAASVWVAIVAALFLVAARGQPELTPVVSRLARVAVVAAIVLAISGIGNTVAQLNTWSELASTTYGRIVLIKAAALILAALAGYIRSAGSSPRSRPPLDCGVAMRPSPPWKASPCSSPSAPARPWPPVHPHASPSTCPRSPRRSLDSPSRRRPHSPTLCCRSAWTPCS